MCNELENAIKTVKDVIELAPKSDEEQLSYYFYRQRDDGKYIILGLKQGAPTDITIPACVAEIAKNAFSGLFLTSVTFNEGLEKIGDFAFSFSSHINTLSFPSTLKKIGIKYTIDIL